ncbi:hypothetical protein CRYPA_1779 [uncultured Candidatus Thioglobus sp.]|nr:hypothetical protein CRYPA_1779 [uncultured Candidatus Thioglobus sp.]
MKNKPLTNKNGDVRELTQRDFNNAVSFKAMFPDVDTANVIIRGVGRPKIKETKQPVTIRLDPKIIKHFKKDGRMWQTRINEALLDIVER